jgi:hypothetical protein
MVSVKCITETCPLCDIVFNVIGDPDTVQCGGCGVYLTPYDSRPDPEPTPDEAPEPKAK